METAKRLAEALRAFVDSLDDGQRVEAVLPFGDEAERRTWAYWPMPRKGLPLRRMDDAQRTLAFDVVSAATSAQAYAKVNSIVALERVLDRIEEAGWREARDPSLYFLSVFGEPDGPTPWGVRFEGHHVSFHLTVIDSEIATTPCFLGANPATVWHGDRVVSRPLAEEEDVARELLCSLDDGQRARAVVSDEAPDDILTSNLPVIEDMPGGGLALGDLGAGQRATAELLIDVYLERMPQDVAGAERDRLREGGLDRIAFAWAGSVDVGERHYYRLAGPAFLIEYDNTQDDANHAHAVWRDRERDFGTDLLREHLLRDH
jgi:hypothetical protein